MKAIALISLMILGMSLNAQDYTKPTINDKTGRVVYMDVIEVSGMSQENIYINLKSWIAHTYNSYQDVVQFDDKDNHKIMLNSRFTVYNKMKGLRNDYGDMKYSLTLEARDGRFRYTITDFIHNGNPVKKIKDGGPIEELYDTDDKIMFVSMQSTYDNFLYQTEIYIQDLITSLTQYMNENKIAADDDW